MTGFFSFARISILTLGGSLPSLLFLRRSTAFFRVLLSFDHQPSSLNNYEADFCGSNPLAIACAASMSSDQSPFASLQSKRVGMSAAGHGCLARVVKLSSPKDGAASTEGFWLRHPSDLMVKLYKSPCGLGERAL